MVPQYACAVAGCALVGSRSRGPSRNAPGFVTKLFRLAAATLIAIGLLISLVFDPVLQTSKFSPVLTAILYLALGAHSNRLGRLGN